MNNLSNNNIISDQKVQPHVVIFPLPIQGPVNCMLKLAELILTLSHGSIFVTFLNTHFIQSRLDLNSAAPSRLARFGSAFRFETVSDGLGPDNAPPGPEQLVDITNNLGAQARAPGSRLREVLAYGPGRKPVTCIIGDGYFWFLVDVAKEMNVPLIYFETVSPSAFWTYFCVPKMIQAGDLPFKGEDLDAAVTSVPGMESFLRRRDLPDFCRAFDPNDPIIKLVLRESENFPRAQGQILNAFDDIEPDSISHMYHLCPNLYTIGPLHLSVKSRVVLQETPTTTTLPQCLKDSCLRGGSREELQETSSKSENSRVFSFSNSMWQEDRSCLAWLDAQPSKSVLFVSFGSIAVLTKEQLIEFCYGLVNSGTRFLWVRRPNSTIDLDDQLDVSSDILEGTKERGCFVSWAPQEEVLAHKAIGGFLTHSGWNSTLESIVAGVPMICWPFFVDQQMNSRLVSEVWKIGLDMKDICDRVVIETMIRDLMETRKDEFLARADEMANLATQAVGEGGSSYNHLNRLVDDIKFMRLHVASDTS